jgi:hypothetical protein
MFDLIKSGLLVQGMIADANHVTDEEVKAIQNAGLRVVNRPQHFKVVTEIQRKRILETINDD